MLQNTKEGRISHVSNDVFIQSFFLVFFFSWNTRILECKETNMTQSFAMKYIFVAAKIIYFFYFVVTSETPMKA